MAKKRPAAVPYVEASLPPAQAAQLLRAQIEKGRAMLEKRPITDAAEQTWEGVVHDLLIRAFGTASPNIERVMSVGNFDFAFGGGNPESWERARAKNLGTRMEILSGFVELLESQAQLQSGKSVSVSTPKLSGSSSNHTVFLVHGHDEAVIQETARLLEKLSLKVVILREQPNQGRTIIEKFEAYSDVGFAVVLLTGDDRGGSKSAELDSQKLRARQNVILELGFFLGRLGRNRVCALYQGDVEIPSDYHGVLFVPLDAGKAWHLALARELKAAEFPIDLNDAI